MNNNIKTLIQQWDDEFKGNLMESIENDIEKGCTLNSSLSMIINDFIPIWIDEVEGDIELIQRYQYYQNEFKKQLTK